MASPRWFTALSEVLSKNPKSMRQLTAISFFAPSPKVYTIATVDASLSPPVPRLRNVVHRSFLRPSPHLPLLVSTTYIDTPKIHDLTSISGSTSAANAEICWWIEAANEQYRFSGTMHVLPRPDHPLTAKFPAKRLAPAKDEDGKEDFDWEKERVKTFNEKIGATLRAWWAHPTPGSTMASYEEAEGWVKKLPKTYEVEDADEETKAQVAKAVGNFTLLVMEPIVVERVQLGTSPNRRTKYELQGEEWKETILAP